MVRSYSWNGYSRLTSDEKITAAGIYLLNTSVFCTEVCERIYLYELSLEHIEGWILNIGTEWWDSELKEATTALNPGKGIQKLWKNILFKREK